MPLYLVRWPNLSFSLVQARNERNLIGILDEVADPGCCRWTVYRGPLFLDFELASSKPGGNEVAEHLPDSALEFRLSKEGGDTQYDMMECIVEYAFPHLAHYHEQVELDEYGELGDDEALRRALSEELREEELYEAKKAAVARR